MTVARRPPVRRTTPSLLGWVYYRLLVLQRWQMVLVLAGISLGVHALMAYLVEPAVHHTEMGALMQSLVLFWGLWFVLSSTLISLMAEVERRHERVTVTVDNVARMLVLLKHYMHGQTGPTSPYEVLVVHWHDVLRGPAAEYNHKNAARDLLRRHDEAEHLEELVYNACFPAQAYPDTNPSTTQLRHDTMLATVRRLQEFRAEAFVDLESNNIIMIAGASTLAAGLSTFLNALEILRDTASPRDAPSVTGREYWVLAGTLALGSAMALTFIVHGNFCLRYNGSHYAARSSERLAPKSPATSAGSAAVGLQRMRARR